MVSLSIFTVLTHYKVMHLLIMKKCDANIKCIYECKKPEAKNVLDSSLMFGAMYLQGSSSHQCFDGLIVTFSYKILGGESRRKIKVSLSGVVSHAMRVKAGAPVCLGSVCTILL